MKNKAQHNTSSTIPSLSEITLTESGKNKRKLRIPPLLRIDPFGNILFVKRALIGILGAATFAKFRVINKLRLEGEEHIKKLPQQNVLFISNHQTYYADVMAMYHVFSSMKWQMTKPRLPIYMFAPRVNSYYIAAEETMKKSGLYPKILSYTGAITVRRSWREKGQSVDRAADIRAPEKIKKALEYGWVVTFPQGTTTPYAPIRKGAAAIIKSYNPIVVPVVIDGFGTAFDKKGLKNKQRGTELVIRFKEPVRFDDQYSVPEIQQIIGQLIEQSPEHKNGSTQNIIH